jgi:tetratricopeptide (TPR) repeat protein
MLHIDRDELERRPVVATEQAPTCGNETHALLAERVVALLLDHAPGREFARRFYLALTLRGFTSACLEDARAWALGGLKWFPADPALLLASGTVAETIAATASINPKRGPMTPSEQAMAFALVQQRRLLLEEACRSFEQALRAEATLEEARLRLGRTRMRLEQPEAARKALQTVVEGKGETSFVYLGHLFLARLEQDEGRLDEAERESRKALATDATAQSAAVALSHVLQLRGEPEAAREVLEDLLASSEPGTAIDPLWVYAWGRAARAEQLLADLRREASP